MVLVSEIFGIFRNLLVGGGTAGNDIRVRLRQGSIYRILLASSQQGMGYWPLYCKKKDARFQ